MYSGLSREEIEIMGKEGAKVKKASRRDLSNILSQVNICNIFI
jgi:pseudouridine-5'-phosphate glycosidase